MSAKTGFNLKSAVRAGSDVDAVITEINKLRTDEAYQRQTWEAMPKNYQEFFCNSMNRGLPDDQKADCNQFTYYPLSPVTKNQELTAINDEWVAAQINAGCKLDHDNKLVPLAEQKGYSWPTSIVEALSYKSQETVVDGWAESAGHRWILMRPDATEIGVSHINKDCGNELGATNFWSAATALKK